MVHLAAASIFARFEQIEPEEFKRVVDVDLTGQTYGAMAALPLIKREGRGALVHVSSVLARRSVPGRLSRIVARGAEARRLEQRRRDQRVEPAVINTPFYDKALTKMGVKPTGFPPAYQPKVVADAILYAAENAPRDIVAGGAGKQMLLGQRLSPRMMDAFMLRTPTAFSARSRDTARPRPAWTRPYRGASRSGWTRIRRPS